LTDVAGAERVVALGDLVPRMRAIGQR